MNNERYNQFCQDTETKFKTLYIDFCGITKTNDNRTMVEKIFSFIYATTFILLMVLISYVSIRYTIWVDTQYAGQTPTPLKETLFVIISGAATFGSITSIIFYFIDFNNRIKNFFNILMSIFVHYPKILLIVIATVLLMRAML